MDVAQIREDLAVVMQAVGFQANSFVHPDPSALPGAMSGLPVDQTPLTLRKWRITLPLTLLFSVADPEDAQRLLDHALSPGYGNPGNANDVGSVYDALHDPALTAGASWESVRWEKADNIRTVMVGEAKALACDVTLVFTG